MGLRLSPEPQPCHAHVTQLLSIVCPHSERGAAGELHGLCPVLRGQWLHHLPPPAVPAHLEGRHPPVRDVRPHLPPRLLWRAGAGGQQMHKYVLHQLGPPGLSPCLCVPSPPHGSQHCGKGHGCVSCSIPGEGSRAMGLPPLLPRAVAQTLNTCQRLWVPSGYRGCLLAPCRFSAGAADQPSFPAECRSPSCESCFSRDFCMKCKDKFYLHKGQCFRQCPPSTAAQPSTRECQGKQHPHPTP